MTDWKGIGLAALLALCPTIAVQATDLTPQDMRVLGYQLLASGDGARASQVAEALLQRDPRDGAALMLQAQILALQKDGPAARDRARLAYRSAKDQNTRFSAAMFMASSLAADRHSTMSQLWLRRAAQASPSDEDRTIALELAPGKRIQFPHEQVEKANLKFEW